MSETSVEQAYRTIAKHIYVAHSTCSSKRMELIILADAMDEAKKLAAKHLQESDITVKRIGTTANAQVYTIDLNAKTNKGENAEI